MAAEIQIQGPLKFIGYEQTNAAGSNGQILTYRNGNAVWEDDATSGEGVVDSIVTGGNDRDVIRDREGNVVNSSLLTYVGINTKINIPLVSTTGTGGIDGFFQARTIVPGGFGTPAETIYWLDGTTTANVEFFGPAVPVLVQGNQMTGGTSFTNIDGTSGTITVNTSGTYRVSIPDITQLIRFTNTSSLSYIAKYYFITGTTGGVTNRAEIGESPIAQTANTTLLSGGTFYVDVTAGDLLAFQVSVTTTDARTFDNNIAANSNHMIFSSNELFLIEKVNI